MEYPTDKYHALFHRLDQGFCVLEVLFDEAGQQAVDYRYLELNPAFAQQSGMPAAVVGHTIRELMPDLDPFWFDTFGQVAYSGATVRVEHQVPQLGRWFDVHAFPMGTPEACQVAVLFTDITARRQVEEQLRRSVEAESFRLQLADALGLLAEPVVIQETVTHLARLHFGADRCYYCEIEDGQFIMRRDAAADGLPSVAGSYLVADFALLRVAGEAGRPFRVRDVRQDESVDDNLRQLCVQLHVISCLNVPVIKNGQPVGQLCLVQSTPREWTDADVALATRVAEHTWAAVERGRAERALRESEKKYRRLFETMDEGFGICELVRDEAGRVIDWRMLELNPALEKHTGMSRAASVGSLLRELFPGADLSYWLHIYQEMIDSQSAKSFEYYWPPSGRWLAGTATPAGGERFNIVYSDITERKRHEANLAFLATVSDNLMRLTNLDETMNVLGEKLAAHLGLSACAFAELSEAGQIGVIRHGWHQAGMPSLLGTYRMAEFVAPEILRRVQSGEPVVIRDVFADPLTDGDQYAALHIGSYVSMPLVRNGEWCFLLVSYRTEPHDWRPDEVELLREVTSRVWARIERVRAEEALRRSEKQFQLFVAASPDALYRMDADWQHMQSLDGKGFLADTNAPNASWLAAYVPPTDQATVGTAIQAAIAGPRFFELEHRVFRADGSIGWTFSRAVPVLNEQGELVEWFGTATDVTARKQAEEAMQQSRQQRALFEAVQATQETERRRMAESLHNGISQILYATRLRLDRLHRSLPGADPALAAARHEADQLLSEAIRQTRALSHELVPLELEDFGLAAALQDIARRLSTPQLGLRSHVALDEAAAPLAPPLQMALYRMAQELALNIVKHAHGATAASLELETMPGWVLLRVEDNGPGFAATSAASPGLGLRSIRDRVALLEGQLESGNVPTGGAYFRIRIPLLPVSQP